MTRVLSEERIFEVSTSIDASFLLITQIYYISSQPLNLFRYQSSNLAYKLCGGNMIYTNSIGITQVI